jgi:serine/threonine protein kinase
MIFDSHISVAQDCWAFGCLVYNVLTNGYPFDLAFIYNEDSRDDAHLIQLSSLLGPLPAKLKHSWPRYGTYFDDEGQLKKFEVDDDTFSYPELEILPEEDCHATSSDTINNGPEQKADETPSLSSLDHLGKFQEFFASELYPLIVKTFQRNFRKGQDLPESLAEYTSLNPPLRERWMDEKHPDMELEESKLVLDLLQGLFKYDPDQRLKTKEILQHAWIRDYCASGDELGKFSEKPATVPRNKRKKLSKDVYQQCFEDSVI